MDELLITEPSLTKKVVGKVEGAEEEGRAFRGLDHVVLLAWLFA